MATEHLLPLPQLTCTSVPTLELDGRGLGWPSACQDSPGQGVPAPPGFSVSGLGGVCRPRATVLAIRRQEGHERALLGLCQQCSPGRGQGPRRFGGLGRVDLVRTGTVAGSQTPPHILEVFSF